jgi:anti-anti-sigma factor
MPYQLFPPCSQKDSPLVVKLTAKVLRREDLKGICRRLLREVRVSGRKTLLLDLREVERPTASGLGKLVALHKKLQAAGVDLALCNVRSLVYEAVEVTGLTRLLRLANSTTAAD